MSMNYLGNEHHSPYKGTNKAGRMTLAEAMAAQTVITTGLRSGLGNPSALRQRRRALARRIRELV